MILEERTLIYNDDMVRYSDLDAKKNTQRMFVACPLL